MRRKYRYRKRRLKKRTLPAAALRIGAGVLGTAVLSLFFIFGHDLITQCRYFTLREITISGTDRIGEDQILRQAEVRTGMNLLSINLSVVRNRLLADPWISKAAIRRVIPSALHIAIEEHRPLAILDMGRRFVIDENGHIFKEMDRNDPQGLPVIRGLNYADLDLAPERRPVLLRPAVAFAATDSENRKKPLSVYRSVVRALQLGSHKAAVLPNEKVSAIQVDREIGITIHPTDRTPLIRLGFNDYVRKLEVLKSIMAFTGRPDTWKWEEIASIDLKNPDRVVVKLVRKKEV